MMTSASSIRKLFCELFDCSAVPLIVRSPGRVNLIGEHTDYNDGFVLPASIDKSAWVAVTARDDNQVRLYATAYQQYHETDIDSITRSAKHWPNYLLGVADQLLKSGIRLSGFNLLVTGDIPVGAGLSSSAALECASLFALNELFGLRLTKGEMVHIAQHAEHEFAGVNCGVMDMFASLFGKKEHVINLDCRTLFYEYVPLRLEGYKLLLLNTNVNHQLSTSAYNTRRQQCEQGVAWVKEHYPAANALRDITVDMLNRFVLPKDPLIYQRCRYVVDENFRLLQACRDLKDGDLASLGKKMFATHEGLSRQYEVSCTELDFLVDFVKENPAVLGGRMMGGGFGGCTINIVREEAIEELLGAITPAYSNATGYTLSHYVVSVENGTELIKEKQLLHV